MALSDSETRQKRHSPTRSLSKEGKWWGDAQKLEAVKTYLMTGNVAMTARILKIPEFTMRHWTKTTWWAEIVDDLKQEEELVLSARLKKIVEKSFDVIEDRLEHGDFVFNQKTGKMVRKQVNMRDAHKVAIDLQEKRERLLNNHGPTASEEQVADKLLKLAEKFAELAGAKKLEANTIDVEDVSIKDEHEEIEVVSSAPLSSALLSGDDSGDIGENVQEVWSPTSA